MLSKWTWRVVEARAKVPLCMISILMILRLATRWTSIGRFGNAANGGGMHCLNIYTLENTRKTKENIDNEREEIYYDYS